MASPLTPFLSRARLRPLALAAATWTVLATLADNTPVGAFVTDRVAHPADFAVRSWLGLTPKLDPRLKIFAYDDQAVASYQDPEIGFADWRKLLAAIDARNPRAIIVDKIFGYVPMPRPAAGADKAVPFDTEQEVEVFRAAARTHPSLAVGAFLIERPIVGRAALPLDRGDFDLRRWGEAGVFSWLPFKQHHVYGPHPLVRDGFRHVGHILYPGGGYIEPFVRLSPQHVVPHVTLYAANNYELDRAGVTVDGTRVPLDAKGRLLLDLADLDRYYERSLSLLPVLRRARLGQAIPKVDPGDVVLILPLLYTGNHDELETPLGRMPGGFLLATMMNSILTGRWITTVGTSPLLHAAITLAGAALGSFLGALVFWPVFLATVLGLVGAGLLTFAYFGLALPWALAVLALSGAALNAYALATARRVRETRRLKDALKGNVPEARLKAILARGQVNLEPSERVVTLMFLDIANFSIVAEQSPPVDLFRTLKEILAEATRTVHKYGGTVDRTLGDGMLCFFGYSYDGATDPAFARHADFAIECAAEIQRENVARCLAAAREGRPMLGFRIGLNTGAVLIGDIGNEERIDFTVIGNGVNYAKRLESACDLHCLMLSATTVDFATRYQAGMPGFKKRFIHVKHHLELIEAIEFNPLHDEPELSNQVTSAFRRTYNMDRKDQRWPVRDPAMLTLDCEFGKAELVDFSVSGICVRLDRYLSRGIAFEVRLAGDDPALRTRLEAKGLAFLKCEVRWGRPAAGAAGFDHGLKLLNLAEVQMDQLFDAMREVFAQRTEPEPLVA